MGYGTAALCMTMMPRRGESIWESGSQAETREAKCWYFCRLPGLHMAVGDELNRSVEGACRYINVHSLSMDRLIMSEGLLGHQSIAETICKRGF